MHLRALFEKLSVGRRLTRRLPSDFGGLEIVVAPESGLRYWKPNVEDAEPDIFHWVRQIVGEKPRIWDIGANIGLFGLASLARNVSNREVLFVEPDIRMCCVIFESLSRMGSQRDGGLILPMACDAFVGFAEFAVSKRGTSASHLLKVVGSTQTGGTRGVRWVPTTTLDALAEEFGIPDVVKIDVETAELLVLEGAGDLLERRASSWIVEVTNETRLTVVELFKRFDYAVGDATEFSLDGRLTYSELSTNLLAVPHFAERDDGVNRGGSEVSG